jgi:hypothetical protein
MEVGQAGATGLRASRAAEDLSERPSLEVHLADDLRERDPRALAARHRARNGRPQRVGAEGGSGGAGGGHDRPIILKLNFNFK